MLLKPPGQWNVVTQFLPNELKFNDTPMQKDDLSERVPCFLSGGLTVLIRGEANMLSALIRNLFQLCMFIRRFYLEECPEAE